MISIGSKKVRSLKIAGKTVKFIRMNDRLVFPFPVGEKPPAAVSVTYNGSSQNNGYTKPENVSVSGSTSGTNAGTYTATYTPNIGYCWSDGTSTPVSLVLTINKAENPIAVTASQGGTATFSTSSQTKTVAAATNAQGAVTYSIQSQKRDDGAAVSFFSISGRTLTAKANTPARTFTVVIRATAAGNGNYNSGYKDITYTWTMNVVSYGPSESGDRITVSGSKVTVSQILDPGSTAKGYPYLCFNGYANEWDGTAKHYSNNPVDHTYCYWCSPYCGTGAVTTNVGYNNTINNPTAVVYRNGSYQNVTIASSIKITRPNSTNQVLEITNPCQEITRYGMWVAGGNWWGELSQIHTACICANVYNNVA